MARKVYASWDNFQKNIEGIPTGMKLKYEPVTNANKYNMKISQSMLKMFQQYLSGDACGIQFEAKYITGTMPEIPPTESQAAGHWFEYKCTGATPRNLGIVPEPVKIKSGDLNAMYRTLQAHLPMWENLRPAEARYGEVISNDTAIFGYELTGITDVITPELIGDIKTTAFIDNKWEEYGWGGDPEYLSQRPTMFQAKFYVLINWLNTGKILPFWFWIFANNSDKVKQVKVEMSEPSLKSFLNEVEYLVKAIENETGDFKPVQSYERCFSCPIWENCKHRQTLPDTIIINY